MTLELDEAKTFPVLLVEDNPGDARLVQELLKEADAGRFEVTHVARLEDARQCLMETGAGCVLLDLSLPDASRLEALMQLRAAAPEVPIVILSGLQDEMLAVKAVQEGAQDYLVKGRADGHAIGRSIAYAVERKHAELELARSSMYDPLTGLPNRTLFLDRLKHAVVRAKRHEALVGVMLVELTTAGPKDDRAPHDGGDRLMVALAERLPERLRASDTAARFGQRELMILLEDVTDLREVVAIARRILNLVGEEFWDEPIEVRATAGIAITDGKGDTAESLIRNADTAMYGAKEQGILLEVFDDDIGTRVRARVELTRQLRHAVQEGDFRLLFQPQVDLRSGQIVGLEALLRWDHPERGLLEPVEFQWLAEEIGLMDEIADWVLEETCRQASAWREAGPGRTPLRICIDISGRRHLDPGFAETLRAVLAEHGIEPSSVCLQLTAGDALHTAEGLIETLRGLKELGVLISMKDFGSGRSSLDALARFPLAVLEVDAGEDPAIVTAVIERAHELGMIAVADGVETREQVEHLKALGCDVGQGRFFAHPRPAEAITELLGASPPVAA
jgi:diguanylate cyclase (GGDEF)-like protein